jgi:hypothetical protein
VLLAITSAAVGDATLDPNSLPELVDLNLWVYVAYAIGLMALCILFLRWRYSPRDDA